MARKNKGVISLSINVGHAIFARNFSKQVEHLHLKRRKRLPGQWKRPKNQARLIENDSKSEIVCALDDKQQVSDKKKRGNCYRCRRKAISHETLNVKPDQ